MFHQLCLDVDHDVIFSLCSPGGRMLMLVNVSFDAAQMKVRILPQCFLVIMLSLLSSLFVSWKSSMHLLICLKTLFGDLSSRFNAVGQRNSGNKMKGRLLNFCGLFAGGFKVIYFFIWC